MTRIYAYGYTTSEPIGAPVLVWEGESGTWPTAAQTGLSENWKLLFKVYRYDDGTRDVYRCERRTNGRWRLGRRDYVWVPPREEAP